MDGLEAVARLLIATGRTGSGRLLNSANRIRIAIRQPVAPTEAGDLEWTLARSATMDEPDSAHDDDPAPELDATAAHALAIGHARDAARPLAAPPGRRRAKG